MPEYTDEYDFADYAQGDLDIPVSRRGLFSAALTELHALSDKAEGKAVYRCANLGSLPDEALGQINPVVAEGCKINLADDRVVATLTASPGPVVLFGVKSPALLAFNLFNGMTSLAAVSQALAEQTGWSAERSFAYTRGLFLKLVSLRVCRPANTI